MKKNFLFLILFLLCFVPNGQAQEPATEIRAVWLTTNWRLDWPKENRTTEQQKQDLIKILDDLKAMNFNTVFFQARAQGKAFYNSNVEARHAYIGYSKTFDPLAFAIAESHKRGMECHAWLITYPMGSVKKTKRGRKSISETKPSHYKEVKGQWYLDPAEPETQKLLLAIVKEVVSNYDIDGIHFDYIRYPDKVFPDSPTFKKLGKGKKLEDWRRNNITQLVSDIYDTTKSLKQWVQVSSSPLGRYKAITAINASDGWTAYDGVFQDAAHWLQLGKHDMLYPMLYYKDEYFYPFLDQWVEHAHDRPIVPGLGVYQMLPNEKDWDLNSIRDQIAYTRDKKIPGQAYFRTGIIMDNIKGVKDLVDSVYKFPAKLPAMTWLSDKKPESPINLEVYKDEKGVLQIKWEDATDNMDVTYNIYVSPTDSIDLNNAGNLLDTGTRKKSYSFTPSVGDFGYYYSVTTSDRFHNESEPCLSAYFSHSQNEQ